MFGEIEDTQQVTEQGKIIQSYISGKKELEEEAKLIF